MGDCTRHPSWRRKKAGARSNFLHPQRHLLRRAAHLPDRARRDREMGRAADQQGARRARGDAGQDRRGQPQVGRAGRRRRKPTTTRRWPAHAPRRRRIRDEARAEGRAGRRREAGRGQRGGRPRRVREADEQLSEQRATRSQADLRSSVDGLSATLASRILGVDVPDVGAEPDGRNVNLHRTADRLRGHRVHHVAVRRAAGATLMASSRRPSATQLAESAEAAKKLADADAHARQGARGRQGGGRARSPKRRERTPSASPSQLREQADVEAERIKAQGATAGSAAARSS